MSDCKNTNGRWVSLLNRYIQAYISKHLKAYNLGCGQHSFLLVLYDNNGISQDTLSDILNIDKGTTAKAVKKLEDEGYVYREVDPDDKRAYRLYCTEKALNLKPVLFEVLRSYNDMLTANFTEEEKELTLKLLKKMSENAITLLK